MSFVFQDGAWGEIQGKKFVPRFTPEEYEFRKAAIEKLESGILEEYEKIELQRQCVRVAEKSIYSHTKKIS